MNKERYSEDAAASVSSNVLNDAFPARGSLSTKVVKNTKRNAERDAADSSAPVETNFLNDDITDGGGLSTGVVENAK